MQGSCTVATHLKHSPTSSVNLPVRPASMVAGCGKITLPSGKLQEMAYSTALLRIRRLRVELRAARGARYEGAWRRLQRESCRAYCLSPKRYK